LTEGKLKHETKFPQIHISYKELKLKFNSPSDFYFKA